MSPEMILGGAGKMHGIMPLYTDEDPELDALRTRFGWFENVLSVEYGEADAPEPVPPALNWLDLLPPALQLGLEDAECSLGYQSEPYTCTLWDVSGEDDLPWLVFLVDDYGIRLLTDYSLLREDEDATNELDDLLARASAELPDRLLRGEFDRTGDPIPVPDWLTSPVFTES